MPSTKIDRLRGLIGAIEATELAIAIMENGDDGISSNPAKWARHGRLVDRLSDLRAEREEILGEETT